MQAFIMTRFYKYEGHEVLGVYSSRKLAEENVPDPFKFKDADGSYTIDEVYDIRNLETWIEIQEFEVDIRLNKG